MKSELLKGASAILALALSAPLMAQETAVPATDPAATASTAPAAGAAPATGSATVTSGATVYDTSGGTVGTIESVEGGNAVLATAKNKVALPLASFGKGDKGPVIAMTAAQVDAAAEAAAPKPAPAGPPKLAKGDSVKDSSGAVVGTIEEVGADYAVVATTKNKVRLPVDSFAAGTDGPIIGMTAAQLDAAAAGAKPGA